MKRQATKINTTSPPITLASWRRQVGVSAVTAWRWAKRGWIRTINVAGRPYVTAEAAVDFTRRAESGEFARPSAGAAGTSGKARKREEVV